MQMHVKFQHCKCIVKTATGHKPAVMPKNQHSLVEDTLYKIQLDGVYVTELVCQLKHSRNSNRKSNGNSALLLYLVYYVAT